MSVVVGYLTENTPRMLTQVVRAVRSLRWFGGALADARVVVCGVGELEAHARGMLDRLGAEVRVVSRFHPANPTANRLQLIASLLDEPEDVLLLLDCDTIIVRDPSSYIRDDVFQAKIAPAATVTDEVFTRLFAHFGIRKPPRVRTTITNEPTVPYYNAGVLVMPREIARTIEPVWRRINRELADHPKLIAPCERHMHQASLALALAETGVPCAELPEEMNHQINVAHIAAPRAFVECDPVIIHYHHLATDDGFLLPCPYPATQARIEQFHARMREEGFAPATTTTTNERASRPIVILGMHRSGTSLVAQLVGELGVYAGGPAELPPPDIFNPTGFWEHSEVVKLNEEVLGALGASWIDTHAADVSRIPRAEYEQFVERARTVARSLQGRGAFLIKDPRMSLLFPLWREALGDPVCVLVWREPMAVARSLATRDRLPLLASLAAWEHSMRTLLHETQNLPRIFASYENVLAEPQRVAAELHATLTRFGIEGLTLPSMERLRQFVNKDFNRSGRASDDESLLDDDQRALLDDLRSGAALDKPIAATSPRTLELLAELTKLHAQSTRRGELLDSIFASNVWRIARRVLKTLRGGSINAEDRWRAMRD